MGYIMSAHFGDEIMRTQLGFPMLGLVLLGAACGGEPPRGPETKAVPGPVGMRVAPPAAPTPSRPAGSCQDPVLIRAFADLTSCNFRDGVIDYQCAAWKQVHKLVRQRELDNRALVQLSLVRLLDDSDERVRLVAAKSLATYSLQTSISRRLITSYGREKSAFVRGWIIHSLHSPRPEVTRVVLRALTADPAPVVRARAAQRLNIAHFAKDPQVALALVKAIKTDKSVEVRKRAAESLGTIRRDKATEKLLVDCLSDPKIGPHCAIGLGRMRSQAGYDAVLTILRNGLKNKVVHPLYVWTVMDFVGRPFFRPTAVRQLLQSIVKSPKMPTGARHYAVKSLGRLGLAVASQKAAVVQFLGGLAGDKILGISVKPTLDQLRRAAAPGRGIHPRR